MMRLWLLLAAVVLTVALVPSTAYSAPRLTAGEVALDDWLLGEGVELAFVDPSPGDYTARIDWGCELNRAKTGRCWWTVKAYRRGAGLVAEREGQALIRRGRLAIKDLPALRRGLNQKG